MDMGRIGLPELAVIAATVAGSLLMQIFIVGMAILLVIYVLRRWFKAEQRN
jgi:uncharacterized membrane protein YuzA (DUF378 family)